MQQQVAMSHNQSSCWCCRENAQLLYNFRNSGACTDGNAHLFLAKAQALQHAEGYTGRVQAEGVDMPVFCASDKGAQGLGGEEASGTCLYELGGWLLSSDWIWIWKCGFRLVRLVRLLRLLRLVRLVRFVGLLGSSSFPIGMKNGICKLGPPGSTVLVGL